MNLLVSGLTCIFFEAKDSATRAKTSLWSIIWLILAYLFRITAKLCLSPESLSNRCKLVPARMVAFMFGVWYLAIAIGIKASGILADNMEKIANENGLSWFCWMLTSISKAEALYAAVRKYVVENLMLGAK